MSTLAEIAMSFEKMNIEKSLIKVLKNDRTQLFIEEMIHDRIYSHGITGTGVKLRTDKAKSGHYYSTFTEIIKDYVHEPINRVTLTDTGDFWRSLKVLIKQHSFITKANFEKKDGHMFKNFTTQFGSRKDFENAVTSLNKKELNMLLNEYLYPAIYKDLNEIF